MKSWTFYILGSNLLLLFLDYRLFLNRFLLLGGRVDSFTLAIEHRGKLLVLGADVREVCLPTITLQTLVDGIEALVTLDLPKDQREEGTLATTVLGVMKGCMFVRVHNVLANRRAVDMTQAILQSGGNVNG